MSMKILEMKLKYRLCSPLGYTNVQLALENVDVQCYGYANKNLFFVHLSIVCRKKKSFHMQYGCRLNLYSVSIKCSFSLHNA